jgi:tetratricopeptide (TPR) repeat protein
MAGCTRDPNVRKQKYLESGQRYEKDAKYKEAVIQFSNALKVDKGFAPAHYELGMTYFKMGSIAAGYQEMLKTVALNPANLPARLQVGKIQLAAGSPDRAADQVKAILAIDPKYADAYALAAAVAARKGDRDEALVQIDKAIAIDGNKSDYHTTLALLQGRDATTQPTAVNELQKAISLDEKNVTAHLILAALLEKKGDIAGSERECLAAIKVAPKDLQARRDLAGVYLRAGDKAKGEETLKQASDDLSDTSTGASVLSDYYLAQGNVAAAESAYADLVSKHPKSFELRYAYARILMLRHEDDKASAIEKALEKESPSSPEVAVLHGSLLLNQGKVNESFDVMQKAAKNSPDNLHLLLAFSKVAELKGDTADAESALRDAGKLAPGNIDVQSGLAEVANRKNDNAMLAQVAEATLEKNPNYALAYLWRGTSEANQQKYDKAEQDFKIVLAKLPTDIPALIAMGQVAMIQKRVPEALGYFEKALTVDPNSLNALNRIVLYHFANNHPEAGIARIKQQLAIEPRNIGFLIELASADMRTRDLAGARDAAKQAYDLAPANEQALSLYSQALVATGDKDGALAAWTKWHDAHPDDAGADVSMAELYEARGDQQKAMDLYQKALDLKPGQPIASNNLAYLLVENNKNLDTAMRLAQDARNALPHSSSTADTLAWVFYAKGRYPSARDLLEDAVKADPANVTAQYHLGMTYQKLGDKTNAALHLKKAATLGPDSSAGKSAAAALAQSS